MSPQEPAGEVVPVVSPVVPVPLSLSLSLSLPPVVVVVVVPASAVAFVVSAVVPSVPSPPVSVGSS
jgi:hypothetical protein